MRYPQLRVTNPGTGPCKSVINIPPIFMTFISTQLMANYHPVSKHKIALEPKHLIMLLPTTFCLG